MIPLIDGPVLCKFPCNSAARRLFVRCSANRKGDRIMLRSQRDGRRGMAGNSLFVREAVIAADFAAARPTRLLVFACRVA
jgi:hypothetical protein